VDAIAELSGLANRREFYAAVDAAAQSGQAWTVFLVDLDRFAVVNALHGVVAGDLVLSTVGDRLRACVTDAGAVARLGGDEFGVLVTWDGEVEVARLTLAMIVSVEQPIDVFGGTVEVGCTLGVAHAAAGDQPIDVLEHAERDRDVRKAYRRETHSNAPVTTAH
jgi:diguanylate cyclase